MDTNTNGSRVSNIVAACIIAIGLIASALIVSRPPTASGESISPAIPVTTAKATPLITQASAAAQFRRQVLAAPELHTYSYEHKTYTLRDVKVTSVIYDAKQDVFTIVYDYVWQPAVPSKDLDSGYTTLSNDGYGHYYSPVIFNANGENPGQHAYITIK